MRSSTKEALPPLSLRAWLRYDVVARMLRRIEATTVLEVGCGQGGFGARLADRFDYLGAEPDPQSCAVATRRIEPRGGRVICGTDHAVKPGRTFDLVCAFEVLEHIEQDADALRDWIARVRPGGHLLVSVPAHQSRFGPMDTLVGHYRRYEPDQLIGLMAQQGLQPIENVLYGWPLSYALESVRNRLDGRRAAESAGAGHDELSAASGRTFQPPTAVAGAVTAVATLPFRWLQRLRPGHGTGIVAMARKPG